MKTEKIWSETQQKWVKVVELWSEEEEKWRKEIVDYTYVINDDLDNNIQFQGIVLEDGRQKLYFIDRPWIAKSYYKKIIINPAKFSMRPSYERTYEVITSEGKRGLYITKNLFKNKPELIVPEEFDMIRTTSMAIGVRKGEKSGLYSYEGKIIVPIEYSRIITGEKVVIVLKNEVRPNESKYAIFGDKEIGLQGGREDGICGVYSYDGKHILEDEYFKIEEKLTGIKAWVDEKNYKMFSFEGEEM